MPLDCPGHPGFPGRQATVRPAFNLYLRVRIRELQGLNSLLVLTHALNPNSRLVQLRHGFTGGGNSRFVSGHYLSRAAAQNMSFSASNPLPTSESSKRL